MKKLESFVTEKMRMSHIYQPVMIKALLKSGGQAERKLIAEEILTYDFSQLEYYEKVVDNMVGRVLRNHNIVDKQRDIYSLVDFNGLKGSEIDHLIKLCDAKIEAYIEKRGNQIWEHRRRNRRAVPGSIRYEVLRRARGRCELCGISKDEKALEVDHITPKNQGGADSIFNYQALCYSCNSTKRDTDDTDFRNLNAQYGHRERDCIFCNNQEKKTIMENHLAVAFFDNFPVTNRHTLVIPKRHCETYFDLAQPELNAIHDLLHKTKELHNMSDSNITGFNIGMNNGESAGQTINHCHVHLIPRRSGDATNPIGGVRNVIPGMGKY